MSLHKYDGGVPLKRHAKKKFPGRGRKAQGKTMNPEAFTQKTAAATRAKTAGRTKRPLVGR